MTHAIQTALKCLPPLLVCGNVCVMNKLSPEERARILHMLCEGMAIRAIERMTGVSKNTIIKLLNDAGAALGAYQDKVFRNLSCKHVQVDEIWSFTHCKQKNVKTATAAPEGAGDVWTWTAIDAETKLVFSVLVGGRDAEYAAEFVRDLASRVNGRIQLTSDGLSQYLSAVYDAFGRNVDYAQLVKIYGSSGDGRYSSGECIGTKIMPVSGNPSGPHINTAFVERQNLTMRMHMRRFTRLTNGFSKKVENHVNAISLHFAYYNLVKVHKTLRMSPAMAAGVTGRLWEMADLVAVIDAAEEAPKKRGSYKKRSAA